MLAEQYEFDRTARWSLLGSCCASCSPLLAAIHIHTLILKPIHSVTLVVVVLGPPFSEPVGPVHDTRTTVGPYILSHSRTKHAATSARRAGRRWPRSEGRIGDSTADDAQCITRRRLAVQSVGACRLVAERRNHAPFGRNISAKAWNVGRVCLSVGRPVCLSLCRTVSPSIITTPFLLHLLTTTAHVRSTH